MVTGFDCAYSMNWPMSWMSDEPFTTSTRSSVARSATGVKSAGCQGVSACSGVVTKLPEVVEMP